MIAGFLLVGLIFGASLAGAVDSGYQAGEESPGGAASTRRRLGRDAFSQPAANLNAAQRLRFAIGNAVFKRLWVTAPASTQSSDGLGPLFNARACQQCHVRDGRGRPPRENGNAVSFVLRLSVPAGDGDDPDPRLGVVPEPTYGTQLQDLAVAGQPAEGRVQVSYQTREVALAGDQRVQLRQPSFRIADLGYGPMAEDVLISPRIAPPMIGLGLLEQVEAADWLAWADPDDRDGDGISGRPNRVWSHSAQAWMPGRFGWKAGKASLDDQNQAAFANDIGIGVPLHPAGAGECTARQPECLAAPDGKGAEPSSPEADREITELVLFYTRHVAVPDRTVARDPRVLAGKARFLGAGCAACHRPSMRTAPSVTPDALSGQTLWPYTDLLLHDMGEGLADHRPEADADGREWRTPPLWGIGLTEKVSEQRFFLHDGRARTLLEAILWHGGEAEGARNRVVAMEPEQRANLLRFLESL